MLTFSDDYKVFILNCYLPCDNYKQYDVDPEFIDCVSEIERSIDEVDHDQLVLCGDMNCDFSRNNAHSKYIETMTSRRGLKVGWYHDNARYSHTYVNNDMTHQSTIDHYILSNELYQGVDNADVHISPLNPSFHRPVIMHLSLPTQVSHIDTDDTASHQGTPPISWVRVTDNMYEQYRLCLQRALRSINIPDCVMECEDVMCEDRAHLSALNKYCSDLVQCCIHSGQKCFPVVQNGNNNKRRPFWNELVKPKRDDTLFWGWLHKECGSPREGIIADVFRKVKREYHYAVRFVKRHKERLKKQKMAECLISNSGREFWREAKKMNDSKKNSTPQIDGIVGSKCIAEHFAEKYRNLYNSVPPDGDKMNEIKDKIQRDIFANGFNVQYISAAEVKHSAQQLKSKKSDGDRGLNSNHMKYAHDDLYKHVSYLFTSMIMHGYSPDDVLIATISSLPKDRNGDLCDSTNYRGIALISCLTKMLDLIMIHRYKQNLKTSDLQYAFKQKHSTVMCNLTLKETVSYYLNRESDVYCVALDASKAFDRVRYDKLFDILYKKGMPSIFIRFLIDMYERQCVRSGWNGIYSEYFHIVNGIRQGGIVSPLLYTVYADSLIERLEREGYGCHIGHEYFGVVSYADDMNILCPSIYGAQKMIDTCMKFGAEFDIMYNEKKTMAMCFSRKRQMPEFKLVMNGCQIKCVEKMKHLGITVSYNLNDSDEISNKHGDFIGKCNHVLNKYAILDSDVTTRLFLTNCSSFYGCETWDFKCHNFKNILTSWNIAIRKIWGLPWTAHRFLLPLLANCTPPDVSIYKRFLNVICNMLNSNNDKMKLLSSCAIIDSRSYIRNNVHFIADKLYLRTQYLIDNLENSSNTIVREVPTHEIENTEHLRELRLCQEGRLEIPGFGVDEIAEMYSFLSTM